jgi:transposase
MKLREIAKHLPQDLWAIFEPILPPVEWCGVGRPPYSNQVCLHGLLYVLVTGIGWDYVPPNFPCGKTLQGRFTQWLECEAFQTAWRQLAEQYEQMHGINWDKIFLDGSKKPAKKGGEATGPSPVDRAKCGTALHLATDEQGLPFGVVVTGANANEGQQTQTLLEGMVLQPPSSDTGVETPDVRDLPHVGADGAYGNGPTRQRAANAGFRMQAPRRGQARPAGLGRFRSAVERGHAFFSHFGRIARRFDRQAARYVGWIQLAACVILIRAKANGFFRSLISSELEDFQWTISFAK